MSDNPLSYSYQISFLSLVLLLYLNPNFTSSLTLYGKSKSNEKEVLVSSVPLNACSVFL